MDSAMAKKDQVETTDRAVSDHPKHTLERTIRLAEVIEQKNGGRPLPPTELAIGLGLSPGSSDYRILLSSSLKYGLTTGSYKHDRIALTPLGARLVAPTSEGDQRDAVLEAALHNSTFRRIFEHFKGKKLPDDAFFENAVVREFAIPREHASKCVKIFRANAEYAGLVQQATTGPWLISRPLPQLQVTAEETDADAVDSNGNGRDDRDRSGPAPSRSAIAVTEQMAAAPAPIRVFISHGKNMEIVGQIKTMLNVAEVPFEIAVEQESTAIPVPEKVFAAMRNCTAAIICVTADDATVQNPHQINQNVLIEIGAAFVLYDKRVILVWDKKLQVPSNLQGLYRCEFEGNELSWSKGMKLMESIKQFKSQN